MKILFVTPWARALSRVYCDELTRLGHDVRLVTSTRHYENQDDRSYELLVHGSPKNLSTWPGVVRVSLAARRFRPDVVVGEEFNDPRLLPMLALAPLATIVHDDAPHDPHHVRALRHRVVYRHTSDRADLLITYSGAVERSIARHRTNPTARVALPSEAGEHLVPPFVPAGRRRDLVLLGRISSYKNLTGTFEAWAEHVRSSSYRGDRLLVIGGGRFDGVLPEACEWRRERFQFADVLPVLAAAKASLAYYSSATQSGVQVTSMQCGTNVLVSDAGGLAEYLPPGEHPVPLGRPADLATAMGEVADPEVAERRGRAARATFEDRHHVTVATRSLVDALDSLRAGTGVLPHRA